MEQRICDGRGARTVWRVNKLIKMSARSAAQNYQLFKLTNTVFDGTYNRRGGSCELNHPPPPVDF